MSINEKNVMGIKIKFMRIKAGLSQADLASLSGYSVRSISNWECGKGEPRSSAIEHITRICNERQNPSDDAEPTFKGEGKQPHHSGVRLKDRDSREGSVEVGVYAFAGAGGPMELFEHEPIQTIDIPQHWIKPELQAVLIRGRSMEPSIIDGAVVGVDTQDKKVISGELYAVWLDYEGAVVKRLFIEQNIVRVSSDNPAFKEMQIKNDEINTDTFVLGKVCWLMQSY